jgi:hypothetical protein
MNVIYVLSRDGSRLLCSRFSIVRSREAAEPVPDYSGHSPCGGDVSLANVTRQFVVSNLRGLPHRSMID